MHAGSRSSSAVEIASLDVAERTLQLAPQQGHDFRALNDATLLKVVLVGVEGRAEAPALDLCRGLALARRILALGDPAEHDVDRGSGILRCGCDGVAHGVIALDADTPAGGAVCADEGLMQAALAAPNSQIRLAEPSDRIQNVRLVVGTGGPGDGAHQVSGIGLGW